MYWDIILPSLAKPKWFRRVRTIFRDGWLDAWLLESQEEEIGIYQSSLEAVSPQEGGKESK